MTNAPRLRRSLISLIAESLFLIAIMAVAVIWIIPSQTRGIALGLSPGFLPSLCAATIGVLLVADGLLRIGRTLRPKSYQAGWLALCIAGGLAALSTVLLDLLGVAVCTALTLPLGMLALGERRWVLIVATTLSMTGCVVLLSR